MLRRTSFLLCLTIASSPLFAHSELPTPTWCEGGSPREVATFRFGPDALAPRSGSETCTGGSGSSMKNCGQFDDDYKRGFDASQGYCGTFQRARRLGEVADGGSVTVLVTSPRTFLSSTHHADYAVSQGLEGICVRCEGSAMPVEPVRPRNAN